MRSASSKTVPRSSRGYADASSAPAGWPRREKSTRLIRTEGQRLLLAVERKLAEIGAAVGASSPAVCLWRDGQRSPGTEQRRALEEAFGIPAEAWERVPTGTEELLAAFEAEAEAEVDDDDDDDAHHEMPEPEPAPSRSSRGRSRREPEPDEGEPPTALEDYNRLLRALRHQLDRPGLVARERVQVADAFSRALAHKERLERGRDLVEPRVIKDHPKWKELKAAIITALLDFPEAARAVEAAVTRVLGAEPDADA